MRWHSITSSSGLIAASNASIVSRLRSISVVWTVTWKPRPTASGSITAW